MNLHLTLLPARAILAAAMILATEAPTQQWLANSHHMPLSASVVYDEARDRAVFVGDDMAVGTGMVVSELVGTDLRRRPVPATARPTANLGSLCFDAARGRVLRFGGLSPSTSRAVDDFWSWDGNEWQAVPAANLPPARELAAMCYDRARDRVVMFGGQQRFVGQLMDTWEFDGASWQQFPSTGLPSIVSPQMVYDEQRGVSVLVGVGSANQPLPTMEWNGAAWLVRTTTSAPGWRQQIRMAYDVARARTVLIGGLIQNGASITRLPELWEFDGTDWTLALLDLELERSNHHVWYDRGRGRVMMYGGGRSLTPGSSTTVPRSDLRSWDGTTLQLERDDVLPTVPGLLFEDAGTRHVFVGSAANATDSETWTYEDDTGWQRLLTATALPARSRAAVARDLAGGRTLLFGGLRGASFDGDLWAFDGNDWSLAAAAAPAGPAPRGSPSLCVDLQRNVVVLFGGVTGTLFNQIQLNDTWEWDGLQWQRIATARSPAARSGAPTVYDPARQRVVLFGGTANFQSLGDSWEYDGTNWLAPAPANPPGPLSSPQLWFDPGTGRVLLYGGAFGRGELWHYRVTDWAFVASGNWPVSQTATDGERGSLRLYSGGLLELSSAPATLQSYGAGCGTGVEWLAATTRPRAQDAGFGLEAKVRPGSATLFIGSIQQAAQPLGAGCTLLVGPRQFSALVLDSGRGFVAQSLPLTAPVALAVRGLPLHFQAATFDAQGISLSAGLRAVVGD